MCQVPPRKPSTCKSSPHLVIEKSNDESWPTGDFFKRLIQSKWHQIPQLRDTERERVTDLHPHPLKTCNHHLVPVSWPQDNQREVTRPRLNRMALYQLLISNTQTKHTSLSDLKAIIKHMITRRSGLAGILLYTHCWFEALEMTQL